jgi:hypothetical protein
MYRIGIGVSSRGSCVCGLPTGLLNKKRKEKKIGSCGSEIRLIHA